MPDRLRPLGVRLLLFSPAPLVQNLLESGNSAVQAAKRAWHQTHRSSALGAGPEGIQLGRWHYDVEKAVEASGIPFTILKPISFMQTYLAYGNPDTIKGQNAFYSSIGSAKISYIDTRDISAVAAKCLKGAGHEGKHYELTGPEAISNVHIAELISQAADRNIQYVGVPEAAATDSMTKAGMPAWLVTMLTELNAIGRAGYLASTKTDVEICTKEKPISFEQFVRDHINYFKV
jgi:uncharacterized protein YbjT (DUF2867 family)